MSDNDRHVVPNQDGGWDVKKPGAQRASGHYDTQQDATVRAREITASTGGETVIHRPDGTIRNKDTSPKGNDPMPPRDKH